MRIQETKALSVNAHNCESPWRKMIYDKFVTILIPHRSNGNLEALMFLDTHLNSQLQEKLKAVFFHPLPTQWMTHIIEDVMP